jgi:RecJ-like exonuclease
MSTPQNLAEAYSLLSSVPLAFADPVQIAAVDLIALHEQCLEIATGLSLDCDQCAGTGRVLDDDLHPCVRCNGTGKLQIDRDYLDSLNLQELRMVLKHLIHLQESM